MLYISRSVSSALTHLRYFHRSSLFLSKVIAGKLLVTFRDLKYPWRHDEGSLVAIFRLGVSSLLLIQCLRVFRMVFVQKRRFSFLSHGLLMERPQNWTDLRSPISKFRDTHLYFIYITDIHRWKFRGDRSSGVAMTSIKLFARWSDLMWPGDLTLSDLGLKVVHYVF